MENLEFSCLKMVTWHSSLEKYTLPTPGYAPGTPSMPLHQIYATLFFSIQKQESAARNEKVERKAQAVQAQR